MLNEQDFRIQRSGGALRFTGIRLAQASSRGPAKSRWTELTVYQADTGLYLLHVIGRSCRPSETDRFRVTKHDTAEELVNAVCSPKGRVSQLGYGLLNKAAKEDYAIDEALTAWEDRHADDL